MSGVRLQERLYGQTGKEDESNEMRIEDDKSPSGARWGGRSKKGDHVWRGD